MSAFWAKAQIFTWKNPNFPAQDSLKTDSIYIKKFNSEFFRNSQPVSLKHRIWLDLIDNVPNGIVSRTVIGYVDGATDEKDRLFDAVTSYKTSQNFYSILNNDILCIQGKGLPFVDNDVIPLGYKAARRGSYSVAIAAVDGVFNEN